MTGALYTSPDAPSETRFQRIGLILIIILITCGLSISFRERDLGDTSLDFQNGVKFTLWFLILVVALFNIGKLTPLITSPSGYALSLLTILALTSAAWSEKPLYTFACAVGFASYNLFAAISLYEISDEEFYKIIRHSLLGFVGLGFVGALISPESVWLPPSIEETSYRLQGFAANPNNFGRIAALLFLLGLGAWTTEKRRTVTMALSIGLGLAGLILSGSRTALAASLLASIFVLFRKTQFFRSTLLSLALLSITLLFFMSYGMSLATLFKTISRTGLESEVFTLTGRTDLWSAALEMIAERPLFGWGFNSTEEHFSLLFNQDFYGTPINPHQMLLHLTMGTGLIGAFLALSLFAFRIKNLFERPNTLDDLLTLFILIYGLTEVDLFGTPLFTSLIFFRVALQDGAIRSRS